MAEIMVDALEEGKIVRVSERYAQSEGLMILRRYEEPKPVQLPVPVNNPYGRKSRTPLDLDKYRKPLDYKKNNIVGDLKDNFNWDVSSSRKARNMTRRQLAVALGTDEETIKMVENGLMPSQDFILVSKLEKYFGINLRKDGQDFHNAPAKKDAFEENRGQKEPEIEIFEESEEKA